MYAPFSRAEPLVLLNYFPNIVFISSTHDFSLPNSPSTVNHLVPPHTLALAPPSHLTAPSSATASPNPAAALSAAVEPPRRNIVQIVQARPAPPPSLAYHPPPPPFDPYKYLRMFVSGFLFLCFVLAVVLAVGYFLLGSIYGLIPNLASGSTVLGGGQNVVITQSGAMGVGTVQPHGAFEVTTAAANKPVVVRFAGNLPTTVRVRRTV
jgi:hypothetical protein